MKAVALAAIVPTLAGGLILGTLATDGSAVPSPTPTPTPSPTTTPTATVTLTPTPTSVPTMTEEEASQQYLNTGVAALIDEGDAPALDQEQAYAVMLAAGWPVELLDDGLLIGQCESNLRPEAIGDGGDSLGWLQIQFYHSGWARSAFEAGYIEESEMEQWDDPIVNAKVGLYIRDVRGRFGGGGGWTCSDLVGID